MHSYFQLVFDSRTEMKKKKRRTSWRDNSEVEKMLRSRHAVIGRSLVIIACCGQLLSWRSPVRRTCILSVAGKMAVVLHIRLFARDLLKLTQLVVLLLEATQPLIEKLDRLALLGRWREAAEVRFRPIDFFQFRAGPWPPLVHLSEHKAVDALLDVFVELVHLKVWHERCRVFNLLAR